MTDVRRATRLSAAPLWKLQRAYFERAELAAWRGDAVPLYVTNNPVFAQTYAEVLAGVISDVARSSSQATEPLYIVELGAGCGRFAYYLLRALDAMLGPVPPISICYVLTDLVPANVELCRRHPKLRPFVDRAMLDFAVFDAERDQPLFLLERGVALRFEQLVHPLAVIANYFFDGLPQDVFRARDGALAETLVTVEPSTELQDAALRYQVEAAPARGYADAELDAILESHRALSGFFLFPSSALHAVRRLAALARGRMVLLSADRGAHELGELTRPEPHEVTYHGSISLPVNYHAIGELFRLRGGCALSPPQPVDHLSVHAFLLGEKESWSCTERAFGRAFSGGGPDDFFTLRRVLQDRYAELDLEQLLALLRMSRCDPKLFGDCAPHLSAAIAHASSVAIRELVRVAGVVWENYYDIGERFDLPFELGRVLYDASAFSVALEMFRASQARSGDDPSTRFNAALCLLRLGNPSEAASELAAAAASPDHPWLATVAKQRR